MPNENLKQFIDHLKFYKEITTKSDLAAFIKVMTEFLKRMNTRNLQEMKEMRELLSTLAEEKSHKALNAEMEAMRKEMIKKCKTMMVEMEAKHEEEMGELEGDINSIKNDKSLEIKFSTLASRLPTKEQIAGEITGKNERIRDGLELLQGDDRFRAEKKIDELEKEIKALKARPIPKLGMRKVPIIKRVNLTSQTDGTTRAFTLPRDTVDILGVFGTDFPMTFDTADWTLSGQTLTLSSSFNAPQQGATLWVLIEALFYG